MLRVYCDTGGFRRELIELQSQGLIELLQFKYENRNKFIKRAATPSNPAWRQLNCPWTELKKYDELTPLAWVDLCLQSKKFEEILKVVGPANRVDAQHLDSAYASGCTIFLTSDKDDICSRRESIRCLTGLTVLHVIEDWTAFLALAYGNP